MPLPQPWPAAGATGWAPPVEANVQAAYDLAAQAAAAATGVPGVVQVESFSGASDAAKMSAAMSYAAAQTNKPWLQLPARTFNTGTSSFTMYPGMRVMGPGWFPGPKNLEIAGALPPGKWQTSCGTGTSSLINSTVTTNSVAVVGVAFQGTSGSQIFSSSGGNGVYPSYFSDLTFYGCKHAFGNPTSKYLMTQTIFDGHWTVLGGFADTQFTLGGSDNFLKCYVNIGTSSPTGAGKPMWIFDGMSKTDIHYLYVTAEADWLGVRVINPSNFGLKFWGGTFEGRAATNLATRPVFDIQGGVTIIDSPHLGYVSNTGSANGVITQSGGHLILRTPVYLLGSGVPATFPLLYQTGGTAHVERPVSLSGVACRVRWANGTTDDIPVPGNSFTGAIAVPAAATDAATTQALVNSIRAALIEQGLAV
jgi:hypothetical protein